jgi:hypothetical protein
MHDAYLQNEMMFDIRSLLEIFLDDYNNLKAALQQFVDHNQD